VRSSVRPRLRRFQGPLAGMVIRGSGPNLIGELDLLRVLNWFS
jgi:hypothetical protein